MESIARTDYRQPRLKRKRKSRITLPTWLLIVWTTLFVVMPLLYIFVISFMQRGESWGIDYVFTLDNYKNLFDSLYQSIYLRSLGVALFTAGGTLLIGYPFAYGLARLNSRWKSIGIFLLMAPFWTNSLLRLYGWNNIFRADGWLNSLFMTLGVIDEPAKLLYTTGAVLVAMIYALLPMMILSIYNSTEKLDWAQVEAARDLGAGRFRAFLTVTLPQTLPGILAGCVLVFVPSMGLFFISDLLGGSKTVLIGNLIQYQAQSARNLPFSAALSVLMLLFAALIIFLYTRASKDNDFGRFV